MYSTYKKQWTLHLASLELKPPSIAKKLQKERLACSRVGIYKFLKHYRAITSIGRKVGFGRPSKVTAEIKKVVGDQMRLDDKNNSV